MGKIILISILVLVLLIVGCTQKVVKIECNKPYIKVGTSCCLDKDDNSICDRDEVKEDSSVVVKEKIVEKKVEVTKYICADGNEVIDKTDCIDYIDSSWDLSSNKAQLITILNAIKSPLGRNIVVDVSKLLIEEDTIDIRYTQKNADYQAKNVGQTMHTVLKETANYLKENKKLDYNIKVTATTTNGGYVFSKTTSKADILSILNYDLSMDEWIGDIQKLN